MKIALPSNDGVNIFPGMLGRARQFYIYESGDQGKIEFLEVRENPCWSVISWEKAE